VASLSQGRTAAAQCGLFTHKSVPVIFEPPCICGNCIPNNHCQYNHSSLEEMKVSTATLLAVTQASDKAWHISLSYELQSESTLPIL